MNNTRYTNVIAEQEIAKAKLKTWRKISLVFGLIPPIGYIILNIVLHAINASSADGFDGWGFALLAMPAFLIGCGVCLIMTVISLIRIVFYSRKSGEIRVSGIIIAGLSVLLVFSPLLISGIWTSVFRNNASSDLYYSNKRWGGLDCDFQNPIREYNEDTYLNVIGCMVADYYKANRKYPTEANIQFFLSEKYPGFGRDGYRLVVNSKSRPNRTDFVIQYGVNCHGETKDVDDEDFTNGFSIYSPIYATSYNDKMRTCTTFNPGR